MRTSRPAGWSPNAAVVAALLAVSGCGGGSAVSPPPAGVATVSVSPSSASLVPTQVTQFTATPADASGNPMSGQVVQWSSTAAAVASVDGTGQVTGLAVGSTTITATSGGRSGTATVTVAESFLPVDRVFISPSAVLVPVGTTITVPPTLRDVNQIDLTGRAVAWASADPSVASVSSTGAITGLIAGTTTVTATSEGKSGSATITVRPPAPGGRLVAVTAGFTTACGRTSVGFGYCWGEGVPGNGLNRISSAFPVPVSGGAAALDDCTSDFSHLRPRAGRRRLLLGVQYQRGHW